MAGTPKSFKVTGVTIDGRDRFIQYKDVRFVFNWDSGNQPKGLSLAIAGTEVRTGFGSGTVARFTARFATMGTTAWELYAGSVKLASGTVTLEAAPAFEFKANPSYEKVPGVCSPQCVGFIKAHLGFSGSIPLAYQAWTSKLLSGLGYVAQGNAASTRAPRPGDILVWSSRLAGTGHVAVVKSVDLSSNTMVMRDANWDNKCGLSGDVTLSVSKDAAGRWTVADSSNSGRRIADYLLGWMSKDEAWPTD